jgi:hypothetical protein
MQGWDGGAPIGVALVANRYNRGYRFMEPTADLHGRLAAVCSGTIIVALYVVGWVSNTELRHFVQTLPLWLGVGLGLLHARTVRWVVMPLFLFWLIIMVLIWLYLLGWSRLISGHFSPIEIAMTLVIGIASLVGLVRRIQGRQGVKPLVAIRRVPAFCDIPVRDVSDKPSAGNRSKMNE